MKTALLCVAAFILGMWAAPRETRISKHSVAPIRKPATDLGLPITPNCNVARTLDPVEKTKEAKRAEFNLIAETVYKTCRDLSDMNSPIACLRLRQESAAADVSLYATLAMDELEHQCASLKLTESCELFVRASKEPFSPQDGIDESQLAYALSQACMVGRLNDCEELLKRTIDEKRTPDVIFGAAMMKYNAVMQNDLPRNETCGSVMNLRYSPENLELLSRLEWDNTPMIPELSRLDK